MPGIAPDERELQKPNEPATKGKLTDDRFIKNAQGWVELANRQIGNGTRYYRLAAEWYLKAGNVTLAKEYNDLATRIQATH